MIYQGDIQNVQCWLASRNRVENHFCKLLRTWFRALFPRLVLGVPPTVHVLDVSLNWHTHFSSWSFNELVGWIRCVRLGIHPKYSVWGIIVPCHELVYCEKEFGQWESWSTKHWNINEFCLLCIYSDSHEMCSSFIFVLLYCHIKYSLTGFTVYCGKF